MKLVISVHDAILKEFKTAKEISYYINKWHKSEIDWNNNWENFVIAKKENTEIDLLETLHNIPASDLLKIAIDLGVDTPDFIPSIPTFRNELKSDFKTAYDTFTKAFKQIESDPSIAVGLANSALESIIKEILRDGRIKNKINGGETLHRLCLIILKEFNLINEEHPKEIKTIAGSLINICQTIEKLRSEKTDFHGKTDDDYLIKDPVYTYFIINAVTTVGLFLISYYKTKFPKLKREAEIKDDLPF
ncbi:MAG: abortive infection family protein [Bacteroidetes bacterium]|nr:abortive infection family protein [Bacteroidota bacterium]